MPMMVKTEQTDSVPAAAAAVALAQVALVEQAAITAAEQVDKVSTALVAHYFFRAKA
jgi:hypothetical protein